MPARYCPHGFNPRDCEQCGREALIWPRGVARLPRETPAPERIYAEGDMKPFWRTPTIAELDK
jgi:hypothetical protein